MCGIAGYSLSLRGGVDRTLAAQALLAGIADRGADAVGYAYRGGQDEYPVVTKQRTPASSLLDRITVPAHADALLIHVRDYTKGHPSVTARFRPDRTYVEERALPAVRAPGQSAYCLARLAVIAAAA